MLASSGIALRFLRAFDGFIDSSYQRGTGAEAVQRSTLDERFQDALVHHAKIDALAKIPEGGECLTFLRQLAAGLQDGCNGILAHIFYARQTESNCLSMRGEVGITGTHVGRLDGDAHLS